MSNDLERDWRWWQAKCIVLERDNIAMQGTITHQTNIINADNQLRERAEQAEAELATLKRRPVYLNLVQAEVTLIQTQRKLAALQERKCDNCAFPTWYESTGYGGHCLYVSHIVSGFACNRWEARP